MTDTHNGILFIQKEQNYVVCKKMDGMEDHSVS